MLLLQLYFGEELKSVIKGKFMIFLKNLCLKNRFVLNTLNAIRIESSSCDKLC